MGTIADKLNYLNQTKTQLKEILNKLGAEILDNATFRSYLTYLDNLYNGLYNLTDLSKNGIVGIISQDGTPTPTTPTEIKDLSGEITYSVSGKNLFDKSTITENTYLNADGTLQSGASNYRTSDYIPIQPNTEYYKTATGSPRTKYYDSNKQPLSTSTYQDISIGGSAGTFTTPNNASYLRITLHKTNVDINNVMINKGTTLLPYEPYIPKQNFLISLNSDGYDIHLDKINTYEDKIYCKDNKFYLYKINNSIILNGTEDWEKVSTTLIDRFGIILNNAIHGGILDYIQHNAYSNYFPYYYPYNVSPTENKMWLSGSGNDTKLVIDYTTYGTTTLEQWKTWLSTHNLIVYYVLNTPTETEITSTSHPTLYNQLKEIQDYLIKYKVNNELILGYGEPNIEY